MVGLYICLAKENYLSYLPILENLNSTHLLAFFSVSILQQLTIHNDGDGDDNYAVFISDHSVLKTVYISFKPHILIN